MFFFILADTVRYDQSAIVLIHSFMILLKYGGGGEESSFCLHRPKGISIFFSLKTLPEDNNVILDNGEYQAWGQLGLGWIS